VVAFEACVCHMGRGKNVYDHPGGMAHESFIYNVAHGRLDAYTFDLWNMNQCLCADPQPSMDYCKDGFYRWSINAIAWTHNVSSQFGRSVPKFDEPAVSLGWTKTIGPHRVGMVGESLFVHSQVRLCCWCRLPIRSKFIVDCSIQGRERASLILV
jgi:hypothetical protein